jgi:uridine kinase
VVVLAGPSGSGKSRLASRLNSTHGWPIFRLDDFYRDLDDPALPRSEELGIVDWDHPDSWDADRALAALLELVDTGRTDTPDYDISTSRAVGHRELTAAQDDLVLAEGIFAAEVVAGWRRPASCTARGACTTDPSDPSVRRLARDLASAQATDDAGAAGLTPMQGRARDRPAARPTSAPCLPSHRSSASCRARR